MRLNKELAQKIIGDVDSENGFLLDDGKIFSNLGDLKEGMKEMSDEIFFHHTGEGRNDFSNWIYECIGDARLADGIINLDKGSVLKKIRSRISYIEVYLEKTL